MLVSMSDELPPPPLRLRPRKRDDEAAVSPQAAPLDRPEGQVAGTPPLPECAIAAESAPGRFRLKPKLTPGADEPTTSAEAVAIPPLRTEAEDGTGVARLKLKSTVHQGIEPTVAPVLEASAVSAAFVDGALPPAAGPGEGTTPAAEELEEGGIIPGIEPLVAPLAVPPSAVAARPPALPAPGALPAVEAKALKLKAKARNSRLVALAASALLLLGGGAGGYFFLMQEEPPPAKPVAVRPAAPPVAKPAVTPVAAAPVTEAPLPPSPAAPAIEPLPAAPAAARTEATVATKPTKAPAAPVMTAAFRLWLEGVRINGVSATAGAAPRVIINGRLVRPGDTIDSAEAITFDSLDVDRRMVMFRNRAGMVAGKSY